MNPFLLKGYNGSRYFCDRIQETETLINAIKNNQDITLYGYRRLGKSALIHHVFNKIKKEYRCIYADVWGTSSVEDFATELANGIIRSRVISKRGLNDKLISFLKSIGASFSIGSDGLPSVNLVYNDRNQTFNSLEELFGFLSIIKEPIVFAIDEFQEIQKYTANIPFEGKLRTLTQQCTNIVFIYSGSEHHILNTIFNTYNKPFYHSTRMISIGKIDAAIYKEFIIKHFKKAGRTIDPAIIDYLLNKTHYHTYYVQAAANYLFSQTSLPGNVEEFEKTLISYILEKEVFYSELPERLTRQQFEVVKGFGKTGYVKSPTSADFMELTHVRNSSSMHRAINSLLEKQLIIEDENSYRLYDVFLELFLKFAT